MNKNNDLKNSLAVLKQNNVFEYVTIIQHTLIHTQSYIANNYYEIVNSAAILYLYSSVGMTVTIRQLRKLFESSLIIA